jgi:hypothetical protein
MKKSRSESELYHERIKQLTDRLENLALARFTVAEFAALCKLTGGSSKIPTDEDLALLEKAAEEIENGTR